MKYSNEVIGSRIRQSRKECGLTQEVLADRLNVTRRPIGEWEKGNTLPELSLLLNMCAIFDCEMGYLLGEHEEKTRVATDICKETGLTENAVQIIRGEFPYDVSFLLDQITDEAKEDLLESIDFMNCFPSNHNATVLSWLLENGFDAILSDIVREKGNSTPENFHFYSLPSSVRNFCKKIYLSSVPGGLGEFSNTIKEEYTYNLAKELSAFPLNKIQKVTEMCELNDKEKAFTIDFDDLVINIDNKETREKIEILASNLCQYSYGVFELKRTEKERQFAITDSFLDLVKEYIKE